MGKPCTTQAPRAVAGILRRVWCHLNKPLRRIAKEAGTSRATMAGTVREAGGRSLRLLKRPLVSARDQQFWVKRCRKLLNNLKLAAP